MGKWVLLLGGLTIWAAHFFLLYAFASLFPGRDLARILSLAATLPALAASGWLLWFTVRGRQPQNSDDFGRWVGKIGALGAALAIVAVLWQALPALMV